LELKSSWKNRLKGRRNPRTKTAVNPDGIAAAGKNGDFI